MVDYSITLCYSNYALRMKYEFDYSRKQGYLRATPHNVSFGKQHCVKMQITVENPHIFYPRVH